MSGVSDEIVSKTALALADEVRAWPANSAVPYNTAIGVGATFEALARAALEAVYGDIRKQVAEEVAQAIEAERDDDGLDTVYSEMFVSRLANIARRIGAQS